ncbi:hypothetical protein Hdeb2414_s0591g00920521 [Helianthus debilis subsp. tardiflorus]
MVNTHRHPTGFLSSGMIHFSHVSFFLRASISDFMASFQFFDLSACSTVVGVASEYREATNALAFCDRFPLATFAIGYFELRASFSGEYLFGGTPLFALGGRAYLPVVSVATGSTCSVYSVAVSDVVGSTCSVCFVVTASVCSPVISLSWLEDIENSGFIVFLTSGIKLDGVSSVALCSADCVVVFEGDWFKVL